MKSPQKLEELATLNGSKKDEAFWKKLEYQEILVTTHDMAILGEVRETYRSGNEVHVLFDVHGALPTPSIEYGKNKPVRVYTLK